MVVDEEGNELTIVDGAFMMPGSAVTIKADFVYKMYRVNLSYGANGTASVSKSRAGYHETIIVDALPDEGYIVEYISIVDQYGNPVTEVMGHFDMPQSDVNVHVSFKEAPDTGALHMEKYAKLQKDGTWTISLDAFAKGLIQLEVEKQVTPTDIIMVLDQSGSMKNSDYEITVGLGTYSKVTDDVTNSQIVNGNYYFYSEEDDAYYPVEIYKIIESSDSYWKYTDKDGNECHVSLADAEEKIGTSYTVNRNEHEFEEGKGYFADQFVIYQRGSTGNGNNRRYYYDAISGGSYFFNADGTYNEEAELDRRAASNLTQNNALTGLTNAVTNAYSNMKVMNVPGTNNAYAIAYVPAELVNNDTYYYEYSYTDAYGNKCVIGQSAKDTGAGMDVDSADYNVAELGSLYTENTEQTTRLPVLKKAAKKFIDDMKASAIADKVDHRIAVVGFSGSEYYSGNNNSQYYYANSEIFVGETTYNYAQNGNYSDYNSDGHLADDHYDEVFQSVINETGYNNLYASIDALDGNGPTYPEIGMLMAKGILAANSDSYQLKIDGEVNENREMRLSYL